MGKIVCSCGHIIVDQSDMIRNKGHIISDQDYMDFHDEIENKNFMEQTRISGKYFHEVFQCTNCNNIIFFRLGTSEGIQFTPIDKEKSNDILCSYLGQNWLGILSARFANGKGDIFWRTNLESGFRQELSLYELKELYHTKFEELKNLEILRHSFLRVDDRIEHEFENK